MLCYSLFIYIIATIILFYLSISAFIRLKMHFWHTQPVFHIYNLKYWIKPPGFINLSPPPLNKFVNLINNQLLTLEAHPIKIKQICHFIRDYYVRHPTATYRPTESDILAYLEAGSHPSFFNVYQEPRLLFDPAPILSEEILGVASARVLTVTFQQKQIVFPAYYVDHLCVQPVYRKKGLPPQMIQTFYYNVARTNPKVRAYMFKREGQLTAVVPLVYFKTYTYDLTHYQPATVLTAVFKLIALGETQMNLLIQFLTEQKPQFVCIVLPDVASVLHLLKLEKLLMYAIIFNGQLHALYVFRPLALVYGLDQKKKQTAECIAIIKTSACLPEILCAGFNVAWQFVCAKTAAEILLIEETAHSSVILAALKNNPSAKCLHQSPTAFFLYNYACYTCASEKTLLVY